MEGCWKFKRKIWQFASLGTVSTDALLLIQCLRKNVSLLNMHIIGLKRPEETASCDDDDDDDIIT
jgi:hypothetical protein